VISNKYLNLAKAKQRIKSETGLANLLGISKQNLYKIRQGGKISGDLFLKVSEATEIDVFKIMGEIYGESSDSEVNQRKWKEELKKVKGHEFINYNNHVDQTMFSF
jgi:predicted transcriptional regulator